MFAMLIDSFRALSAAVTRKATAVNRSAELWETMNEAMAGAMVERGIVPAAADGPPAIESPEPSRRRKS